MTPAVEFATITWRNQPVRLVYQWVGVLDAQAPVMVFLHEGLGSVSMWRNFLPMPEAEGGHVVVLSDDTVLMAASAPQSAELIRSLGYRVVTVDISEFEKLEGCVTCLSVLVK